MLFRQSWKSLARSLGFARPARREKHARETVLRLEALEERQLMAADVSFASGTLKIVGDDNANAAWVDVVGNNFQVKVQTTASNGSTSTITKQYASSQVKSIEFYGYAGNDKFYNNTNVRSIGYGGAGDDYFSGGSVDDWFYGDLRYSGDTANPAGKDTFYGNNGNDYIYAGAGADSIYGGAGDDILDAGAGADYLNGGTGKDTFYGGADNDRYQDDFTLFVDGTSVSDIQQGESGVCTILAAIGSTIGYPVQGYDWNVRIKAAGTNQYDVWLYNQSGKGYWERTTFDGSWTDDDAQPVMGANGVREAWVIIVQRAALERNGVRWDLTRDTNNAQGQPYWGNSWRYESEGLEALTGKTSALLNTSGVSAAQFQQYWQYGYITVSTPYAGANNVSIAGTNFVGSHAYTVLNVYQSGGSWFVQLYNPWGVDGYNNSTRQTTAIGDSSNDGKFVVSWSTFTKNFTRYAYTYNYSA